jgi:RNA polymerase sigma factor (sigma-70 family)
VTRGERQRIRAWLVAVADGDRTAFDPLFAALWPVVTAYCARLVADRVLAEDVAQEVLARIFTRAGEYDPERDALSWVLGVATWQCRTARRQRARRGETALDARSDAAIDAEHERRDLIRAAVAAVAALPDADAATIAAAVLDDDDARAGLAPATFRKRLERALARLRMTWRSRHGEV